MATNFIAVPMRIEAKYLPTSQMVTSPLGDYTRLPWNDGSKDINFETAFLGDAVIHHPFENQNLLLGKGIHLHFIVPHYLGQQVPASSGLANVGQFPAAPNRWLVTKRKDGVTVTQWVIESDYIYAESDPIYGDTNTQPDTTCIIPFLSADGTGRPFRFMGRKTPLDNAGQTSNPMDTGDTFKSLNGGKPLTVIGYGDPNFSSFYPNCVGVFGFKDPDETPASGLSYSILGWHSDQSDDLLFQFLTHISTQQNNTQLNDINTQLQNLFRLDINNQTISSDFIPHSVFYGSITVDAQPSALDTSKIQISLGNTGTEALSALMAQNLGSSDPTLKSTIEDQLESMLLFSKLDHLLVDTGPKFLEARHEKGFRSTPSGHIWKVVATSTRFCEILAPASATTTDSQGRVWLTIANEGQSFSIPSTQTVRYGANQGWNIKTVSGLTQCNNSSLGPDPTPGIVKTCQLLVPAPTASAESWLRVATQGQTLSLPLAQTVRYGCGTNWVTKPLSGNIQCSDVFFGYSDTSAQPALPDLPSALAGALHQLNLAQFNYDQANHAINSLREQLYMDWCRYMQAAYPPIEGRDHYPDPDHVRYFIETHSFNELRNLIGSTGALTYADGSAGFKPTASGVNNLATATQAAWTQINTLIEQSLQNIGLSLAPATRFWEPNPPVVLISGLPLDPSDEADDDDAGSQYTQCVLMSSPQSLDTNSISTYNNGDLLQQCGATAISSQAYSGQVWNPFILEWEADLFDTHLEDAQGGFDPKGVTTNFNLNLFGPDFTKTSAYAQGNLSVFSGSVIMSPSARRALLINIQRFLKGLLKQERVTDANIQAFLTSVDWSTAKNALGGLTDSATLQSTDYATNPLYTAWMTYQALLTNKVISQALNGFNQACIMRRKSAQLPIAEPLGFENGRNFTAQVSGLVLNAYDTSPITAFDFNPIRSGQMSLNRLRLIDNFGISTDLNTVSVAAAETLRDDSGSIFLPPRLSQPARLNFRWLSAEPVSNVENTIEDAENSAESNDHPDTSPVCGWLIANYFDNSLAVFDADGNALGYLDSAANWNLPPWVSLIADINSNISNGYLRNVVTWLRGQATVLQDFITATQVALDNVAPANANQYTSQALLMGRPMAVVRARVSLQVKGLPALEQSWPAMLTDLSNCDLDLASIWSYAKRYNKNWPALQLPVRLGEHQQLNDGLLGYWVEDSVGNLGADFEAPETDSASVTDTKIDTFNGASFQTLNLALDDAPINLTLLVDPRGVVHATSGVLPTKAISIDPNHYLPAFKKMGLWFYTSPLLQPSASLNGNLLLNLPAEAGYAWSWWDKFGGMRQIAADETTKPTQGANTLIEGWLTLNPQPDPGNS